MLLKLINKFLKQPLKLEMFVPCDENGNVLEEPEKYGWLQNVGSRNSYATEQECIDCETFHLAKQKVLFEGFEMSIEKNAIINNGKKIIRIHGNNTFSLNGKLIITIEDLLNTNTNTMSKEFKGTQGQWVLEKDGNSAFFINSTEREEIVSVWIEDDETEAKANALLISKAPEMLEALQFFVNNNMLSVIGEEVAERLINEILE